MVRLFYLIVICLFFSPFLISHAQSPQQLYENAEARIAANDPTNVLRDVTTSCDQNYGPACDLLGQMYSIESSVQDYAKAYGLFVKGCNLGDPGACEGKGNMEFDGKGTAKNEPAARQSYIKACNGGDTLGCYYLGTMQYNGQGGGTDLASARRSFETACTARNAKS